ncbi:MAG: hypothetical protein IJO38_04225 [Akkermansia sp.]|nr:hypothetical protein [Akkermansia sp.]
MRKLLYMAGISLALGNMSPAQAMTVLELDEPRPVTEEAAEARQLGQAFLQTASEMWMLLSGVSCKQDADAAAARFSELVRITFELDNRLSSLPLIAPEAECVGMMDSVQLRILETMDDLHVEFLSICRARCYGSEPLVKAFEQAIELGMFAEEDRELLESPGAPLSEEEARAEIARLDRLEEPDKEVLQVLETVMDEEAASKAAVKLTSLSLQLKPLVPAADMEHREFAPEAAAAAQAVLAPLEPILWAIRSEIVRIAALPGYEAETYDDFSVALDLVFESLGATHTNLFDSVFDASFRTDLDNALRENSISSQ